MISAVTNGGPTVPPGVLRRLDSASASALADLNARFEDLQMVLRCCERLMSQLTAAQSQPDSGATDPVEPDGVVVEALWSVALLSYARCFSAAESGTALTEDDLTATGLSEDVLDWHKVLLQLRDHYADPTANPRERFSVVVTQDADSGSASGIGITSARQPLVDDLTVRQTGAIAYALSRLVNDRIAAQQESVFGEMKDAPKADLDKLVKLDIAAPDEAP